MVDVAAARSVVEHFDGDFYAGDFGMMDHQGGWRAAAAKAGAKIGAPYGGCLDAGDLKRLL